ncbi:MAG TPA: response regulator transcription factor [Blastocatellia bacterium]|nr:response regulator transcription factor [Blastocatellia bacterium]
MKGKIHVLIADDHPVFRKGLRVIIEDDPSLIVVAEAEDGQSAMARILGSRPHVAVLDTNMPPPDGLTIARVIRDRQLPVEVVFITAHKDEALINATLDIGVKGLIVKDSAADEIIGCIKAVEAGHSFFSHALLDFLIDRRRREGYTGRQSSSLGDLTPSERRIMRMIAQLKINKEIAAELSISVRTVEHHRSNICSKLGISGKNMLLAYALTHKSEL